MAEETNLMTEWNPSHELPGNFLRVPQAVYRKDPLWIPESAADLAFMFGPRHSFFLKGEAWIGCVPQKARLAGFFDPQQRLEGERVAYFGYWETLEDEAACREVFRAFEAWARGKGAVRLLGPIKFCTHYGNRIRLDRFEEGPFFPGEPYNPPYYPALMRQLGYELYCSYYSWFGDGGTIVENLREIIGRVRARAEERGLRFVPLTPDYWLGNLATLHGEIEEIFGAGLGFSQISLKEFERLVGPSFAARIDPKRSVLTLDAEGRMAAFLLCFPDYAPLLRQGSGSGLTPGDLRYDSHFTALEQPLLLGKTVGVRPRFRKFGLFEIMCYLSTEASLEDYAKVAVALLRDDNLSARSARKVFAAPDCYTHSYGLFAKVLSSVGMA